MRMWSGKMQNLPLLCDRFECSWYYYSFLKKETQRLRGLSLIVNKNKDFMLNLAHNWKCKHFSESVLSRAVQWNPMRRGSDIFHSAPSGTWVVKYLSWTDQHMCSSCSFQMSQDILDSAINFYPNNNNKTYSAVHIQPPKVYVNQAYLAWCTTNMVP